MGINNSAESNGFNPTLGINELEMLNREQKMLTARLLILRVVKMSSLLTGTLGAYEAIKQKGDISTAIGIFMSGALFAFSFTETSNCKSKLSTNDRKFTNLGNQNPEF